VIERYRYRHSVAAEDIDDLGHAGNYHYVRWMQHAAEAHSAANGWTAERYRELGAGWVVRSHQVTYLLPALEGDELVIETWVANLKPATSLRCYEIRRGDGVLLARAETDWAFIKYASQKPLRIPAEVRACFPVVG
jgi:acyl-CoA thioester hydrolase